MGEETTRVRFGFNGSVRIAARGEQLRGNARAMLLREVDAVGVTTRIASRLCDPRDPMLVQYSMAELLRTRLQMIALGFRDQGDADLLRRDPVLRLAVSESAGLSPLEDTTLASQPTMSRLIDTLASPSNLHETNAGLLEGAIRCGTDGRGLAKERATIDVDSFPMEVHGHQAGSEWNGHYGIRCYHSLIAMVHTGQWIGAELRAGNECVCRIRNNSALDDIAQPLLERPEGRRPKEPREWVHDLEFKAQSWDKPRRIVVVVQEHHRTGPP